MGTERHIPALLTECLEGLKVKPGGRYIDATLGGGGHAEAILEASAPGGLVLGIDRDAEAVAAARERLARFGDRLVIARGNFRELGRLAREAGWEKADGVLMDLGFSSLQVDAAGRGFSFRTDARLDMRMDREQELTAHRVVNNFSRQELSRIFRELGEERRADRIAARIVEERRKRAIGTTTELAELIAGVIGHVGGRIHPATRVFQALRIAVNDELESLREALPQAAALLAAGGRLAVIAYHSLEDRLVKETFNFLSGKCACPPGQPICTCGARKVLHIVTRRPIEPSEEEVAHNRRARSAKLRLAEKPEAA